ncbi:hypothetical protein ACHAXN_007792 [Cyclotella atomus]
MLRHRPPLTILLLLYPLLAAASLLEKQFDGAQSGLRRSTLDPSPNSPINQHNARQLSQPTCIGSSLQPSEDLYTDQFLCRGQQRFGILDGKLVLGLSIDEESSNASTTNAVRPNQIAWQAAPTTLFVECSRPFASLSLSLYGNLLGYDANGDVIYDSNLDYGNRIEGKIPYSVLGFSSSCYSGGSSVGVLCLKLTGPPSAGMPWGVITWAVSVDFDGLVTVDETSNSSLTEDGDENDIYSDANGLSFDDSINGTTTFNPSILSVDGSTNDTVSINTTLSPSKQPSTTTPTYLPSTSPFIQSQSIIYGSIWLDIDANGIMDVGEKPIAGVTIQLYQCDPTNNTISTLADTKITDSKGWYFFQVPMGYYKAYFDIVDLQVYTFTNGEDTHTTTGWTDCESPTLDNPIQWNAGLNNVLSDRIPVIAAKEPVIANSKLGGAVFIDLDGDGSMDSTESNAVENGYTVSDATVHVSLHDCEADVIIQSAEVPFPGRYSFDDLTEGLYKVEFDIVSLASNKKSQESRIPLYSFHAENDDTSSFETNCINLRRNDINTSVHAGIRVPKLKVNTKVSEELLGQLSSQEQDTVIQSAEVVEEKKQNVAGIAVGIICGLAILVGAVLLIHKQQRQVDNRFADSAVNEAVKDDLSIASNQASDEPMVGVIVVKTKSEDGTDKEDDDERANASDQVESPIEIDDEFQRDPYNRSGVSSIFELESLGSDPYIFTGDEQESLGSDSYSHSGDVEKWDYPRHAQLSSEAIDSSNQQADHLSSSGYCQSYHADSSSVISERSSDPPAASYRDIPTSTRHIYTSEDYHYAPYPSTYSSEYMPNEQQQRGSYSDLPPEYAPVEQSNEYPFESDESSSSCEESESSFSRSSSSSSDISASQLKSSSSPHYQPHTGWIQDGALSDHCNPGVEMFHPQAGWEVDNATYDNPLQNISSQYSDYSTGPVIDDQSVISTQSNQSADPPGASYQTLSTSGSRRGQYRSKRQGFVPPRHHYPSSQR